MEEEADIPSIVTDGKGNLRTPLEIAYDQIKALEDENEQLRQHVEDMRKTGKSEHTANSMRSMKDLICRQRRVLKDVDTWLGEISKDWKNPIILTKRNELQAAIREETRVYNR